MTAIRTTASRFILAVLLTCLPAYATEEQTDNLLEGFTIIPLEFSAHPSGPEPGSQTRQTPEQAAAAYLGCLQEGRPVPPELTVESPYVNKTRRDEIRKEKALVSKLLSRSSAWLKGMRHEPRYSILKTSVDGNMAVVLYRVAYDDFPLSFLGSSVALVKTDGQWKVAPHADSFSNAGLPYERKIRRRAEQLTQGINEQLTKLLTDSRQDELERVSRETRKLRQANQGKTREELLLDLAGAMKRRDPVALSALLEPEWENREGEEAENNYTLILQDMGMLIEDPTRLNYSYASNIMDYASDASSVIVPLPGKDGGHVLAVVVLNFVPTARMDRRQGRFAGSLLRIELKNPPQLEANPFFLKRMNENINVLGDFSTVDDDLLTALMAAFHQHYPAFEWDHPQHAAREILEMSCRGNTTGLLRSVDPAYFLTGDPGVFDIVLDFCRNVIISTQLHYGTLKNARDRQSPEHPGATLSGGYYLMVSNPGTRMVQNAVVYLEPGGNEAFVLADASDPLETPGISRVKFKLAKNDRGKWQLKVYPGDFPRLDARQAEISPLTSDTNKRAKPTLREDDPVLEACREHFLSTFLD